MSRLFLMICAAIFLFPISAGAQSFNPVVESLITLNRVNPVQNPEYDRSRDILNRRILDRKNRVIGEVKDVLLKDSGGISSLNVDLNRLHLGSNIFLNYRSMRVKSESNSYTVGFSGDQIEEFYPQLLADTETAAGGEDIFSVRRLLGVEVKAHDGRRLGQVEDVLFGARGTRAEALYITMKYGMLRGEKIAIPFSMASFDNSGRSRALVISNERADAVIDFATSK